MGKAWQERDFRFNRYDWSYWIDYLFGKEIVWLRIRQARHS